MSLEVLQDIHLSDKELWQEFRYLWDNGAYITAIQLLNQNQQLATKYVTAEWMTTLGNLVYTLENLPIDFKKKIIVSYLPPELEVGDIWFQIQIGELNINVSVGQIEIGNLSTTISYSDTFINAIAFKDCKEIVVNQVINETNHQVTFSINEVLDYQVTCLVFSTDNANLITRNYTLSYDSTTVNFVYTGVILSAYSLDNNNNRCMCEKQIDPQTGEFVFKGNPIKANYKLRLICIPSEYLADILNSDSGTLTGDTVTLICDGYMVNSFVMDSNNNFVIVDTSFINNQAIFNASQNTETLSVQLYYT